METFRGAVSLRLRIGLMRGRQLQVLGQQADLTVPLSLSPSDVFRLLARPRRHASSERPMSKTRRLTNTIHWLEKNCPNILSSIAVIISLAATEFGRAFRSFEGPWYEPILEGYPALFQFLA